MSVAVSPLHQAEKDGWEQGAMAGGATGPEKRGGFQAFVAAPLKELKKRAAGRKQPGGSIFSASVLSNLDVADTPARHMRSWNTSKRAG